jgi:methionine-rich copper-binding protein CopC
VVNDYKALPVRLCGGLLVLLFLPLLGQQPVWAHAELAEAEPAVGATYWWNRPDEVRLRFTQQLAETGNEIQVMGADFRVVQQGETVRDPEDPRVMSVALASLAPGTYTVNWTSMSEDGDPLQGSYEFAIRPLAAWGGVLPLALVAAILLRLLVRRSRSRRQG